MTKIHTTSQAFKDALSDIKKEINDSMQHIKGVVDGLTVEPDEPLVLNTEEGRITGPIPSNFVEKASLVEISRGPTYAIFDDLKEKLKKNGSIDIYDLKDSFRINGVSEKLTSKTINLILQSRGKLPFRIHAPFVDLVYARGGPILCPNNKETDYLSAKVINSDELLLKISLPLQILGIDISDVGRLDAEVKVTLDSVYLNKMSYYQTSDSKEAKEIFKMVSADEKGFFEKLFEAIRDLFIQPEKSPDLEFSPSPSPKF
ncbi:MAG: hypothetical protein H0U57_12885 [Tatlockia sp.]|nr:hypothetical protein [Tatlockia sp.]